MRSNLVLFARPFAAYVTATLLAAICWIDASGAFADGTSSRLRALPILPPSASTIVPAVTPTQATTTKRQSIYASPRTSPSRLLGPDDEIATLHAIHTALTSVGDGDAYVWKRGNGLLNALIRPTTSFRSGAGEICRHIIVQLISGRHARKMEGIACQDQSGVWSLT
jgi:surface antigen